MCCCGNPAFSQLVTEGAQAPRLSYRFFDRRSFKPPLLFITLLAFFILQEASFTRPFVLSCYTFHVCGHHFYPSSIIITCSRPYPPSLGITFDIIITCFWCLNNLSQHLCLICVYLPACKTSLQRISNYSSPISYLLLSTHSPYSYGTSSTTATDAVPMLA